MIAVPQGDVMGKLYLKPLGFSVDAAAMTLDMPGQRLEEVLTGHRAVTPEIALRLEAAFGQSSQSWLNMQVAHGREQECRERIS